MSKCIRCGKERIVRESRSEKFPNSTVTYTETVCPDPECQKKVESMLNGEKTKRDNMKREKEKQELQRIAAKKRLQ